MALSAFYFATSADSNSQPLDLKFSMFTIWPQLSLGKKDLNLKKQTKNNNFNTLGGGEGRAGMGEVERREGVRLNSLSIQLLLRRGGNARGCLDLESCPLLRHGNFISHF